MRTALIGMAAIALAAAAWVAFMWNEDDPMSGMGGMGGDMTDGDGTMDMASAGALADVVVPAALSAEAETGKAYYEAVCSACHGANAAGQDGVAPPLVHTIYEPSHHGDAAFASAARNGVTQHHWSFGNMPPVQELLTDGEIGSIVAYVRELQRANGIN